MKEGNPQVVNEILKKAHPNYKYHFMFGFSILLVIFGLVADPITTTMTGFLHILQSPSNLITDYLVVGNVGSAFLNSGLLTFCSVLLLKLYRVPLSGPIIASLFTVAGCSFFGKNIFNSIPLILGGVLYAKYTKRPYQQFAMISLFGSSLSPVISYISFGMDLPLWLGISLGYSIGILLGFILPPLASQMIHFHHGFTLYNVGFTTGIIAMVLTGLLRMFDFTIKQSDIVSPHSHSWLLLYLVFIFILFFVIGYSLNQFSFKGMDKIFESSGKLITDFVMIAGVGATLINMSLMGFMLLGYIFLIQADLNGPIIGAILVAVGFSAFGNHLRNSFPVLIGVYFASFLSPTHDIQQTATAMAAIFGTSLAPISGYYGSAYGIIAGFLHMALVNNVGFLHGGLNLYNCGFSSGFVAGFFVPILDNFSKNGRNRE